LDISNNRRMFYLGRFYYALWPFMQGSTLILYLFRQMLKYDYEIVFI
jgi:hypothetical protein